MIEFISEFLQEREALGLRRRMVEVQSAQGPRVSVNGRELLCFCSNNYLGLADHAELKRAAVAATEQYGTGAAASRLVCGSMAVHRELERAVAACKGTQDAILFSSGYAANLGTIPALAGREDAVLVDRLNHASLIDGCRLSGAKLLVYPHCDTDRLEHLLARRDEFRRMLIITDGIFSMDGGIAPLRRIVELAERYGAMTMLDDAHATGILGVAGGGTPEHLGLAGRIDVIMGTLSKAVGSVGGFVAGSYPLVEYLRNTARSFIYTTAPPPGDCAAAIAGLRIIHNEPGRRKRLWRYARRIREAFTQAGLDCGTGTTPIVPLMVGDAERAVQLAAHLFGRGIMAMPIRPPTVHTGTSRLRLTPIATHTDDDIELLISAVLDAAPAYTRHGAARPIEDDKP